MTYAIVSGIATSGVYMLVSIGFTLLLRVADIVNFAHGCVVVAGMYLAIVFVNDLGLGYGLAVPLAVIAGLVPAWLIYELLLRPARNRGHRPQIVISVLLLSVLELIFAKAFGTDFRSIDIAPRSWEIFGVSVRRETILAFFVALAICGALFAVFRYTAYGKSVEVAGKYPDGARSIGLPVDRLYRVVFLTGTAMTLLAGALIVPSDPATPFLGFEFVIVAVLITVASRQSFAGCAAASVLYGVGYAVLSELLGSPDEGTIGIYLLFIAIIAAGPAIAPLTRLIGRRWHSAQPAGGAP